MVTLVVAVGVVAGDQLPLVVQLPEPALFHVVWDCNGEHIAIIPTIFTMQAGNGFVLMLFSGRGGFLRKYAIWRNFRFQPHGVLP
jgi:hypothetical protein